MNSAQRKLGKKGIQKRAWNKKKGSAAHHIVAGDDKRAAGSRAILKKHNIDVNSAENGIYLKHIDPNSKQPGAYHREIHTDAYHKGVEKRLKLADKAGGKEAVLSELESIQSDLLFNNRIW